MVAERELLREAPEYAGIGALVHPRDLIRFGEVVPQLLSDLGYLSLLEVLVLLVVEVQPPVGIEQYHLSVRLQDPEPFPVRPHRVGEVPHDLSGHDQVEGVVLEFQVLRVHLAEVAFHPRLRAVLPGHLEHSVRVVYGDDLVPVLSQNDREKARPGPYVEDSHPAGVGVFLHASDVEAPLVLFQVFQHMLGEAFRSHGPVVPDSLELILVCHVPISFVYP